MSHTNSDPGRQLQGSDDGEMVTIKFRTLSETGTEGNRHSHQKCPGEFIITVPTEEEQKQSLMVSNICPLVNTQT